MTDGDVLTEKLTSVVARIEHLRELMDERHAADAAAAKVALDTAQRAANSHRWLIGISIVVLLGLLANVIALVTRR